MRLRTLGVIALCFIADAPAFAEFWDQAPPVDSIEDLQGTFHKVYVDDDAIPNGFEIRKEGVYVLARRPPSENGGAKRGPVIVGRSFFAEDEGSRKLFVFYQALEEGKPEVGDRLFSSGAPMSDAERALIREAQGLLPMLDKELEDLYNGLISLKVGLYQTTLSTQTNTDSNRFKDAGFIQKNFGLRWWFDFAPRLGMNLEFATGDIPITGFHREPETGSQKDMMVGLMLRTRFLGNPTMFSLNYFNDSFVTTNPDDFILSSTYSGFNLNMTFYELFKWSIFRAKWADLMLNNLEVGAGISPIMTVTDTVITRGGGSGNGYQFNAGLEFHVGKIKFLKNFFFVFEGGMKMTNISFSGTPSTNVQPNNSSSEQLTWYGLRIKFNMQDYLGEWIKGI